ncbi:hypothetical protein MMC24_005755 [Lignoscripta atroalba]|nr:hypothetical protein [Lignoscripta atroalba]
MSSTRSSEPTLAEELQTQIDKARARLKQINTNIDRCAARFEISHVRLHREEQLLQDYTANGVRPTNKYLALLRYHISWSMTCMRRHDRRTQHWVKERQKIVAEIIKLQTQERAEMRKVEALQKEAEDTDETVEDEEDTDETVEAEEDTVS